METCKAIIEDDENEDEVDGLCSRKPVEMNLEHKKSIEDVIDHKKAGYSNKPRPKCFLFSEKSIEAIEDMIVQDMSEVKVNSYDDVDTVKRTPTAVNDDRIVKRISPKEGIERKSGCFKSQIFVKHELEDRPKDDPLGGFLETEPLKDGCESMLHSFCSLDENGFLYKHLEIRNGQYLLSLNGRELSGLTSVNHRDVIRMFSSLAVDTENAMIVFDPRKNKTKNIIFVFGIKEHIVKTACVPLGHLPSQDWRKTEIVAIKLTHMPLFLTCGRDGKLHITSLADWRSNHCCHFEHWNKLVFNGRPECLSVYKHEQMDVFLGMDGNVVELVSGKFQQMNVQFLTNIWNSSVVIRPASKRGEISCSDSGRPKVVDEYPRATLAHQQWHNPRYELVIRERIVVKKVESLRPSNI